MKPTFIQIVTIIVNQHLINQQPINVSILAEQLQLDRTQVYRKIKKATGKSPSVLIREIKLEYGKTRLEVSIDTINTVSHQSGFTNVSYFIRCFKEKYGQTPQNYRLKHSNTT